MSCKKVSRKDLPVVSFYNFQGEPVRVLANEKNEPLFVLNDVCRVLGIINPWDAASRIRPVHLVKTEVRDAKNRIQSTNTVTLWGLHRIILESKKPEAEKFKDWVTDISVEYSTTGKIAPQLDPNNPYAHFAEPVRKATSKTFNKKSIQEGGVIRAIENNASLSRAYFGTTPKKMVRLLEKKHHLKINKARSLPKTLTMTEPDKAVGYSITKHASVANIELPTCIELGKTMEHFASVALAAGWDMKYLIPPEI